MFLSTLPDNLIHTEQVLLLLVLKNIEVKHNNESIWSKIAKP